MADQDQDFRIKVSMDPSSATAGGDAIIAKQAQIKAQLEEATAVAKQYGFSIEAAQAVLAQFRSEKAQAEVMALRQAMQEASASAGESAEEEVDAGERMNEALKANQQKLMSNAFYVHRLAEGFKDLSLGGRAASQGLMDISESLQYMLGPEVAIYAAGVQVVAMLALLATSHHRSGEAAREHGDAEKDAAEEISDAREAISDATATYKQQIEDLLTPLLNLEASDKRRLDNMRTLQGLVEKQIELDKTQAVERVKSQFFADYASAKSEDDRKLLTERKDEAIAGINAGSEVAAANQELLDKKADIDSQKQALADQQQAQSALQANLDQKGREAAAAQTVLDMQQIAVPQTQGEIAAGAPQTFTQGITLTKDGTLPEGATDQAQAVVDDLKKQLSDRISDQLEHQSPEGEARTRSFGLDPEQVQAGNQIQIDDLSDRLKRAQSVVDSIEAAPATIKVYTDAMKDTGGKIAEQGKKIDETNDKIAALNIELDQAKQKLGIEQTKLSNERAESAIQGDKVESDIHWKAWQDTIDQNKKSRAEGKRNEKSAEGKAEAPLEEQENFYKDKIADLEEQLRQATEIAREMVSTGRKHAGQSSEIMAASASKAQLGSLKKELDAYKADLDRVETELRDHRLAAKTNLLQ